MDQQHQNREQRRRERNSKTDSLPLLRETSTWKSVSSDSKENSLKSGPAGPFLNPATQRIQDIPPDTPTFPQEAITPGPEISESSTSLPAGMEPLKPREQKLANDLTQTYFLLGNIIGSI